ncbi:cytochrome c [Corallococcus sp. EGB]|uniref:c-type cytochrome n=1 Tax=Corallococcus sp. EGB TaxID=1521117 RepID=UPI001CBB1E2A|nr:cytochrome c [Corallococcus sp. EGB]
MKRWALLVLLGGVAACDDTDPMASQPRAGPFSPSEFFDDGRAMRPLVPGTVAQEWRTRGDPALPQGLAADGTWLPAVPLPLTRELLDEGRTNYETWCAVCHGLTGDGNAIVARKMPQRRPPGLFVPHDHADQVVYGIAEDEAPYTGAQAVISRVGPEAFPLPRRVDAEGAVRDTADAGPPAGPPGRGVTVSAADAARARQHALVGPRGLAMEGRLNERSTTGDLPHPPGFYFQVISHGFGVMPSYGPQLSPHERWAVVAYLRALGRSQRAPLTAAPPDVQARLRQELLPP